MINFLIFYGWLERTHGAYAPYEKRYEKSKLGNLWSRAGEEEIDIMYQGPNVDEAKKSIEDMETIEDEDFIKRFRVS